MLEIEEIDIDSPEIESVFTNRIDPAFMGLRRMLPNHVRACRIIEAHGYMRRPPKGGRKICWSLSRLKALDESAIRAIRLVIYDFILAEEVDGITKEYMAEPNGDAFNVAGALEIHPYIVIAILRNLEAEKRLPLHPSWDL